MITCDFSCTTESLTETSIFVEFQKFPFVPADEMGKKMGENSKAVAARDRKNEKEQQQKAVKEKAMEDAKWADDDKSLAKKQVSNVEELKHLKLI